MLTQSRRHGILLSLLQIPHLIVAVNKMDLVDYSQDIYNEIVSAYQEFSGKLDIHDITFNSCLRTQGRQRHNQERTTCPGTQDQPFYTNLRQSTSQQTGIFRISASLYSTSFARTWISEDLLAGSHQARSAWEKKSLSFHRGARQLWNQSSPTTLS